MKIGVRLVAIISSVNIIGIGLLAGVTLSSSQKEISRLAEDHAKNLAEKGTEEIQRWFGTYVETARTIAHIMEGYKDIPAEQRREQFNFMLKQTFIAHPEVSSVYANWGPNMIDGMDAEYVNAPGMSETGRYVSAWNHGPQGQGLNLEAIKTFPFDMVMQVTGGEEFVFEPTVITIGGKPLLVANLCIPVKDNGKLVGVTGIAFELSRIQAIADTIKPLGDGYTQVFSSSGMVTAHPNSEYLGKNIAEIDTFASSLDTAVNAVSTGKTAAFSALSPQGLIQYYALPYHRKKSETLDPHGRRPAKYHYGPGLPHDYPLYLHRRLYHDLHVPWRGLHRPLRQPPHRLYHGTPQTHRRRRPHPTNRAQIQRRTGRFSPLLKLDRR